MRHPKGEGRLIKIALGPCLGVLVVTLLGEAALSVEARRLAGIMACTVWWWVSEALPLPVAGLLASCLCAVFSVAPTRHILSPYADPIVFLFMGSFWIAEAMSLHGLDRRLALRFLAVPWVSASPARLVLGVGALAAAMSLWISNTATTAMLLPIVLGILRQVPDCQPTHAGPLCGAISKSSWGAVFCRTPGHLGRGGSEPTGERRKGTPSVSPPRVDSGRGAALEQRLLLMLAFAASVGGLGTPVGTPPNLIGIGMLERLAGVHITFAGWCRMALPIAGVGLLALALMFSLGLKRPQGWDRLGPSLSTERRALGPWTQGQANTGFVFFTAVVLWLFAGRWVPEGIAALSAAGLLFMLPLDAKRMTLTWQEAARIDWGTIVLFGSGMSLGQLLFDTKLAEAIGTSIVGLLHLQSVPSIAALSTGFALVTSELASNTASANVAVPVALAVSASAGVAPIVPALSATLGSSFGFLLPVSTPPNALVYGTGRIPLRRMMAYGLMLDLVGFLVVWFGVGWQLGR